MIKSSRFYEVAEGIQNAFENIARTGDLDPTSLGKSIIKLLKKEDFDQPLYKIGFFQLAAMQGKLNPEKGIISKLPPWSDEEPELGKLKKRNIYNVLITAKNELIVREKLLKVEDLKDDVKAFIINPKKNPDYAETPKKAIISMKNERGTNYELYINVYNEIKGAYKELREEQAIKVYGKSFEKLTKLQQKNIRASIPMVISEAEPTEFD